MVRVIIEIKLRNNSTRSYISGQIVEGWVVITSSKWEKVFGITIELAGKARVKWTKDGFTRNSSAVSYSSEEIYVNSQIFLAGVGQNSIIIPAGTSNYPFQFILPANLPSSFTGICQIAHVSYTLTGNVRRSSFKFDTQSELVIRVNGTLDLNLELESSAPQECTKTIRIPGSFHSDGSITLKMRLPYRSAFVPGDKLYFETEIVNDSHKKVPELEVSLREICEYYAKGTEGAKGTKTQKTKRTICFINGPPVGKGECLPWAASLRIPIDLPPTNLGGHCSIINLKYVVHFKFPGKYRELKGTFPVMIGTIPIDPLQHSRPPPTSIPAVSILNHQSKTGFNLARIEAASAPPAYDELLSHSSALNGSLHDDFSDPSAPALEDDPDIPPPDYAEAMRARS